jgi:histidinol-phosphatase (PHP family)
MGIEITFGSDAHSVEQVGFRYEDSILLAKEIGYEKCVSFENREKKIVRF